MEPEYLGAARNPAGRRGTKGPMPDDTDEHLAALLWLFLGGGDPPQQCLHPTQARNGIADFPLTDAGWCDAELLCCFWPCQFALLTKPPEIDPEDLA